VKTLRDAGEPISQGRLARPDAGALELRDVLTLLAIIAGVVLGSGVAALLLIEVFQTLGWWTDPASEGARDAARDLSARLRLRAALPA
jgi:hypothetical protein